MESVLQFYTKFGWLMRATNKELERQGGLCKFEIPGKDIEKESVLYIYKTELKASLRNQLLSSIRLSSCREIIT